MNPKRNLIRLHFLLIAVLALQACGAANAVKRAETIEQKAYAAEGTYTIWSEKGIELIERGNLPDNISLRLIQVEEQATPVVDSLSDSLEEFELVKDEFEAGTTGEERLIIASNSLNSWIERALPLITRLKAAVKGAQ